MSKNKKVKPLKNNNLINITKDFFISHFEDKKEQNLVKEKIKNICGKTAAYDVPPTLFQGRTARKNRVLMPYEHVIRNGLTYEILTKFSGGVVVEFVNNDFFDELNKPEELQSDIFKILKTKLGSDDTVSAMIDIRSTGSSSSETQRNALVKLQAFLQTKNIKLNSVLIRRKDKFKNLSKKAGIGIGNDKWQGYVFFDIKGGKQDSYQSHKVTKKNKKQFMLFNPSVEYASEKVSEDITLTLLYFAIHSIPKEKRNKDWEKRKEDLENNLSTKIYLGQNLLNHVKNHLCLKIEDGVLYDPIQSKKIDYKEFATSIRDEALDITHELSIKHARYFYDEKINEILTPANPLNLFWSKHLSNMMQQNASLKEFIELIYEIHDKWESINIRQFIE